jgi:uncharacterized protein YdiU (UPF0061 family)
MAQWNIARFAETLLPLLDKDNNKAIEIATKKIKEFTNTYQALWLKRVIAKLGLSEIKVGDLEMAQDLFEKMQGQNVDFTQFFRGLSNVARGETQDIQELFDNPEVFDQWYKKWIVRLSSDPRTLNQKIKSMKTVNPIYIPRNHLVEDAIHKAEQNHDFKPFEKLLMVLAKPYDKKTGLEKYAKPAPKNFGPYKTFCGT